MAQNPITGTLRIIRDKWHFIPNDLVQHDIHPVYHDDQKLADKINSEFNTSFEVTANLIDEFSNPELFRDVSWGMGHKCYKLVSVVSLLL